VTARRATPAQRRALANYRFGSKQGLLEAVFLRRAGDLDSERLARRKTMR
jgi:AcrR family transcriptional regulator